MNKSLLTQYLEVLDQMEKQIAQAKYKTYQLQGKLEAELADEDRSRMQLTISSELKLSITRLLSDLNGNVEALKKLNDVK